MGMEEGRRSASTVRTTMRPRYRTRPGKFRFPIVMRKSHTDTGTAAREVMIMGSGLRATMRPTPEYGEEDVNPCDQSNQGRNVHLSNKVDDIGSWQDLFANHLSMTLQSLSRESS